MIKNKDHFTTTIRFFFLVILTNVLNTCSNPENPVQVTVFSCVDTIVIDGVLSEQTWKQSRVLSLKNNKTAEIVTIPQNQTSVRLCFDEQFLYISFECNDRDIWGTMDTRDQHLWEEEVVEVFIDTDHDPNTYTEIEISPRNVLFDSYIVDPYKIDIIETKKHDLPGIKHAVDIRGTLDKRSDTDSTWNVEISIPFSDLGVNEQPLEWRINFYRINRDAGNKSASYAWSPTKGRFHNPSAFGVLRFQYK